MNVTVSQCPMGASATRRSPHALQPFRRTILVVIAVSSMNTRRAVSSQPCSRIQRRRARATSARCRSAARRLFFKRDAMASHLHCQNVRPLSDYRAFDRYGVDIGCLADKNHSAFAYTEDSPLDWRSGFALLTYRDGRLMYPELVTKWDDDSVQFR